jgi:epoxyqueuosine reductase QueG
MLRKNTIKTKPSGFRGAFYLITNLTTMTTSAEIKKVAKRYGADLCGIAPVERFENAPKGFRPYDIYPGTKSVIAIAKREIESALFSKSPVTYTFASEMVLNEVHKTIISIAFELEKQGHVAIPIPSEPYEFWDEAEMTGKGILSLKHAGYLAGLGIIGKNTLLVNKEYGNLMRLGAIVTDALLTGDPVEDFVFCKDSCNLCLKSCPANAMDGTTVVQKHCRPISCVKNKKGEQLYVCSTCRKVCPYRAGINNHEVEKPLALKNLIMAKNYMG